MQIRARMSTSAGAVEIVYAVEGTREPLPSRPASQR